MDVEFAKIASFLYRARIFQLAASTFLRALSSSIVSSLWLSDLRIYAIRIQYDLSDKKPHRWSLQLVVFYQMHPSTSSTNQDIILQPLDTFNLKTPNFLHPKPVNPQPFNPRPVHPKSAVQRGHPCTWASSSFACIHVVPPNCKNVTP